MSIQDIEREIKRGGRFVMFQYVISILLITFKRPSHIFFIRGGSSATMKGLPYTLLTLLFGWWGIPWGSIYSFGVVYKNLGGGKDMTFEVLASLNEPEEQPTQVTPPPPPPLTEQPSPPPVNS